MRHAWQAMARDPETLAAKQGAFGSQMVD